MKEILIFAGTTEGRTLSEYLAVSGIIHTICVATEYGELVLKENPFMKVHHGRMSKEEIKEFIQTGIFDVVVDATHPYAEMITKNIKTAIQEIKTQGIEIPYLRLKRGLDDKKTGGIIKHFGTNEACAKALEEIEGNILLTIGSKELGKYGVLENVKNRLYVRVLPSMESISLCIKQGIQGKQIIAMQGPFSTQMNEATIRQYGITCMVTKQSGVTGGYLEKLKAAEQAGIPLFVIGNPKDDKGFSFIEICGKLENFCGKKIQTSKKMQIILAGIGMGNRNMLTRDVQEAIEKADILLGAERVIKNYKARLENKPFYQAEQILPYLKVVQEKQLFLENQTVVVLFSGDSGFYSGCQTLYCSLQKEVSAGRLKASIHILPGISSVSYLASCIGESYQDAAIYSMHGKELSNLASRIKREEKTYLLMSGVRDVNKLGRILIEEGMTACEIVVGYQMSYEKQKIKKLTPWECSELQQDGLYTCFIKNRNVLPKKLTHGIADEAFIRDKIPMTKEEVRAVSICKLKLFRGAVIYDIGSGTGSIAVEIAGLSDDIQVYAIEQKKEAVSLIERNKVKFQLENIEVVEAKAPEGLEKLPMATHVFIGGSGGNLKEILWALYHKNPKMRVVINAISMETICEMKEIISSYPIEKEEIVQIQISRTKKIGQYHLMQAENLVWICVFDFCKRED